MLTQTNPDGGFYKYVDSPSSKTVTHIALLALRLATGQVELGPWPASWFARNPRVDPTLWRDIAVTITRAQAFVRRGRHRMGLAFEWDLRPLAMLLAAYVGPQRYVPPVPGLDPGLQAVADAMPDVARQLNALTRQCLPAVSILYRRLRSRNRVFGQPPRMLGTAPAVNERREQAIGRLAATIREGQNENGGWFYNGLFTILNVMALRAAGASLDDPAIRHALDYLRSNLTAVADGGTYLSPMNTDIWDTCLAAHSYLNVPGHTAMDDAIRPAIDFLLRWQCDNGGYAWAAASRRNPDNDCTGLVLWVLSQAERTAAPWLRASVSGAVARGRAFLLERQDSRGGFSVWENTFVKAKPGAQGLLKQCLFDVATPDVTSRILRALTCAGLTARDVPIRRAVTFLLRTQCRNGAWWSRWWAGYIPGSCFAALALCETGQRYGSTGDRSDPLVRRAHDALHRAIGFLLACQNADGGWGETVQADVRVDHAGVGPSTPQYTALVTTALLRAGYPADATAIRRAIGYLLEVMTPAGHYPEEPPTFTFIAGAAYYRYSFHRHVLPLWAFNEYLRAS
jgi:squalene-hopene/tetraprenyl-beta-curcumene cyclase